MLRRAGRLGSSTIEVRDLVLDEANRVATRGGRRVELTKIEFDLLSVLAREPGRVFSKVHLGGELLYSERRFVLTLPAVRSGSGASQSAPATAARVVERRRPR